MPETPVRTSHRPGTATQNKGQARLARILTAARSVFMAAGYAGFTMRKVAEQAGMSVGNLSYYYRTKDDLLRDLIDHVIGGYLGIFDSLRDAAGQSPQKQLGAVLDYWIDDLGSAETTAFFPELWALANHDVQVAALVDDLYARVRQPLRDLIPRINPACTDADAQELALFMCAAMEGLTVFIGNGKPWAARRQQLKRLAIDNFMQMIASRRAAPALGPRA
jgi:AcrR family transcriptional regulator